MVPFLPFFYILLKIEGGFSVLVGEQLHILMTVKKKIWNLYITWIDSISQVQSKKEFLGSILFFHLNPKVTRCFSASQDPLILITKHFLCNRFEIDVISLFSGNFSIPYFITFNWNFWILRFCRCDFLLFSIKGYSIEKEFGMILSK